MEIDFPHIAALIGDPVRANVLWTLLDGRAYTARELATGVGTSPQNLSMHLGKLLKAGLLAVQAQGRHKYYSFAREEVAYAVEAMANLAVVQPAFRDDSDLIPVRYCRSCYDHLAGRVGVLITESLVNQKLINFLGDKEYEVPSRGAKWFGEWGIDCDALRGQRRSFSRPCLDWSERKYHLSGSLGAALLEKMIESHWIRRTAHSRVIVITAKGKENMAALFKIQVR